jgi:hypothetical protein
MSSTKNYAARYFLDCDDDSHWYLVDASRRAEWEKWLNTPFYFPQPDFAEQIDGPSRVEFENPKQL